MRELTIAGTRFLLSEEHFCFTGVSFFNAIYNPAFNRSREERVGWLKKFLSYGVNVLRVWGQYDCPRGLVDAAAETSLYRADGSLRREHVDRLGEILHDMDGLGMVAELALFSRESWDDGIRLGAEESDRAVAAMTEALKPHRNLTFQIWNEHSERVIESVEVIKGIDARRLVSNSPGYSARLGDPPQNKRLDYLSPHTSRQDAGPTWKIVPKEIDYLLTRFKKPVVDNEPARNGTPMYGGPTEQTFPMDHILQIYEVWQLGGYIVYHHDMFQTGYGTAAVPEHGVPDPEFNPYHRAVFEFIKMQSRYRPEHPV